MLHSLRLFFIWAVLCTGLPAAAIDSSFSLFCEWDGQRVPVAAVTDDGRTQAMREGTLVEVPEKARWFLEGDLRSHATLLGWSPNYWIWRRPEPELIEDAAHPFAGGVRIHVPVSNNLTELAGPGLREFWPAAKGTRELLVVAWIAGGKIAQVEVRGLAPTNGSAHAEFLLTREEAAGQAVLLLWEGGRFSPPLTPFADTIDAEALMAAMLDDWPALEQLVRANPKLGSKKTRGGVPLLHLAAEAGALRVVDGLVAADPKGRPVIKDRKTGPMDWAAAKGRVKAVECLLENGFDKDAADKDGRTPLLVASKEGHTEVVAALLKAGADTDIESFDNRRPMTEAVDKGFVDIVELLQPKARMRFADTPDNRGVLRTQAQQGHTGMVRWLLKQGISVDADDGMSPLAAAALCGYEATVTALLDHRASVKWKDAESGNTALFYAVSRDQAGCVRLLLEAHADLRQKNKDGMTALHVAALADAEKCARVLLEAGAEWAAPSPHPFTALDIALMNQNKGVVAAIADHGGRINLKAAEVDVLIEGVLRVDCAPLLQRAIEDGWLPSSKLEGWPALFVAGQFEAKACEAVLEAAGAEKGEPGPDRIGRARDVSTKPALLSAVTPRDPRDANELFAAQTVMVSALIDAQGRMRFPRVLNVTDKRLALAVLDVLPRWEFSPARQGDQPVAVNLRIPVILPSSERRIFSITAVDEQPQPISQTRPNYPYASRRAGEEARVVLSFVINAEGKVEEVVVWELSSRALADAAVKAVRTWRYKPAKRGGKAVPVAVMIPIIFNLND